MIEIIKNPTYSFFFSQIEATKKELIIITPDIDGDILEHILARKNENVFISLITSQNVAKYLFKKTNLNILNTLIDRHHKIYNYQNLNANIYIFDQKLVWITSSDLTQGGLVTNFEYGILSSEENILKEVIVDYKYIIDDESCGKIKKEHIKFIQQQIETFDDTGVSIDQTGDYRLSIKNYQKTSDILKGWNKLIFDALEEHIKKDYFNLNDVYKLEMIFAINYPENYHIKDKIRQVLQYLRDYGYIKFIDDQGNYKKLWTK